ncbi:MAG: hypothetical protein JWN14_4366 [Chthonomonadales bacterium]|nr:hypothetical protein [Chthonomonadales bacterium]
MRKDLMCRLSAMKFVAGVIVALVWLSFLVVACGAEQTIGTEEYRAPALPSPQDWGLVLERVKR